MVNKGNILKYRVDIDAANKAKAGLSGIIDGKDSRLLNKVGAFSSLFRLDVSQYKEPVLVLKTEEPGSKQLLAFQHDRVESVCFDMINHLINDCIVMGAKPLVVQDLIVCGKMDPAIIRRVVAACSRACLAQECVLSGGETTEQPGVVPGGTYILGSSIVGIAERSRIIDGSKITLGDAVIGIGSSGLHSNGYTLVRDLLRRNPELAGRTVGDDSFINAVLVPHKCYYRSLKDLFASGCLHGLAHITGGGIRENLNRILPKDLDAEIDLSLYKIPEVFGIIREESKMSEDDMLRTFNLGVGLVAVCPREHVSKVCGHLKKHGEIAYEIGVMMRGKGKVLCKGSLMYH